MNHPDQARAIADAVLYEGFLLYPYTGSALKNQMPWQFGVLMPQGYSDASERTAMRAQMPAFRLGDDPRVEVTARFLQVGASPVEREVSLSAKLVPGTTMRPFAIDVLCGRLTLDIAADGDYLRVTLSLENHGTTAPQADRKEALRTALVSAHAILTAHDGAFVSLLDPPDAAKEAVSRCENQGVFPVLTGEPREGGRTASTIFASPIILYDFPAISAASRGQTFDATEIDELLLLSVASLADREKQEARATHGFARELVERAEALDAHTLGTLHGKTSVQREPGDESVTIAGATVRPGSRVRVHPQGRTDIWDSFVAGRTASVCAVHTDFEGKRYVGVVFDDDPASEMHEWYGRSFMYGAHEIEPLESAP